MAELCKECNNYCPLNDLKNKDEEPANPARCCDTILTNVDDIVKGSRHGRSSTHKIVLFKSDRKDLKGKFVNTRIYDAKTWTLYGELVEE